MTHDADCIIGIIVNVNACKNDKGKGHEVVLTAQKERERERHGEFYRVTGGEMSLSGRSIMIFLE